MSTEDHSFDFSHPQNSPAGKVIDAEALIHKTFAHDVQAGMEMLFRQYYSLLCSHAVRYVGSKAIAEDIVSDILFEFQSKGLATEISSSFRAYLFTSVRNRAYDFLKKEMRHRTTAMENAMSVAIQGSEQPDSITQFEELHNLIESTIDAMPLRRKQVYVMHRFEGKKSREIAIELKVSQRTVEAHIYKAISQVHEALRQHWLSLLVFCMNVFYLSN
jgi:RNA polymerase sigma-70 factor (family 1)